jgi:hypothetical protein
MDKLVENLGVCLFPLKKIADGKWLGMLAQEEEIGNAEIVINARTRTAAGTSTVINHG